MRARLHDQCPQIQPSTSGPTRDGMTQRASGDSQKHLWFYSNPFDSVCCMVFSDKEWALE